MPTPLNTLQNNLKRHRLGGLLVTQPENRFYLSGFTAEDVSISESAGFLLVPARGRPFLFTDSRYILHAESETPDFTVQLSNGILATLRQVLPAMGIRRLAFEAHYVTHESAVKLLELGRKLGVECISCSGMVEKFRQCKNPSEIEKISASVRLNEVVFREVWKNVIVGMTEKQIARAIENCMHQKGAAGPSFATIVAAGPNGAHPHAVPTDRPVREGEPIIIDMGLKLQGYCSDMTRTVVIGRPDSTTVERIRLVRRAQLAAMAKLRAGVQANIVDRAARKVIRQAGLGKNFGHGLGHGVGLAVHEAPSLNRRRRNKLKPGNVVTVEPGIYIPDWGGVRLENMAVVTENGYDLLNNDKTFLDI